jgi:hypothetical protein
LQTLKRYPTINNYPTKGAQKQRGENLEEVIWVEFSTLSLAVFVYVQLDEIDKHAQI